MTGRITPIVGFLVALWAALPVAAPASPLLSGYGGPGQGNQAILGSALLNGPRSGGGGGSGAAGGSSTTGASRVATPTSQGKNAASTLSAAPRASKHDTGGGAGRGAASAEGSAQGRASELSSGASSVYPASDRGGAAQQSGTLGLSGEDFVYIIVGLGVLALTGVLTKRLSRIKRAGS
jgi:hypothetical protein